MLTEANGVPLAIVVAGANRNDFKLARETIESIVIARPKVTRDAPQGLCLDKGYDYSEVRELVDEFRFTAHIRCRSEEARAIKRSARFKARRWVVERSHSWMNRFRRILVRWEKRADTYVAMLHLVKALRTVLAHGPRTAVRDAQDELLAGLAQLVSLSKVLRSIACRDALSFGRIGPSRG